MITKSLARIFLSIVLLMSTGGVVQAATGDPIQDNNYRLDLTRTVATGSTRQIGMGGACVGLAEGNAAVPTNPAAVAYRPRAFMRPWEFDMVLGTLVTSDDDTDNSGDSSLIYGDTALVDAGVMGQYENFGMGGVAQMSVLSSDNLPQNQKAQFLSGTAAIGYTTDNREWAFGASANPVGARAKPKDNPLDQNSFKLKGLGWGAGMLWHPERGHWRWGAAYKSAVSTDEDLVQSTSPIKAGNLIVPSGVLTTGVISLGTAYEWNHFPLWRDRPAIATFDVHIFNQSPGDANSVKSFLTQTSQPQGQKTSASLHTGLEVEVVPKHLRTRLGTYREPSRYEGVSARWHITGGFELRLTPFDVWDHRPLAISYAIDAAERYQVHLVSIWLYTFTVPVPTR